MEEIMESGQNLGFILLYWCVFGIFVYRSKQRGRTVLYFLGTLLVVDLCVGLPLAVVVHMNADASFRIAGALGAVVSLAAGVSHSRQTSREAAVHGPRV